MRVFISSVTYALKDERNALATLLSVVPPYEPSRFEDFVAQGRSSREACLAGVEACDVYVLLLGPRYGEPFPDSGVAPTEEEFIRATRLGKPVLVFLKEIDEEDEPRQAAFKARVQDYVGGRFRGTFTDPASLHVAAMAALAQVPKTPPSLQWTAASPPPDVVWSWQTREISEHSLSAPIFEVHLVPLAASPLLASRMQTLPQQLARHGRANDFFAEQDALNVNGSGDRAWAWAPERHERGDWMRRVEHAYRGFVAHRSGQVSAFEALPTDSMGSLVDDADLRRRATTLVSLLSALLTEMRDGGNDKSGTVAVAAALGPLDRLFEGDPRQVGGRQRGTMRMTNGARAAMPPAQAVASNALAAHATDVAVEIAAEIMTSIRSASTS